VKTSVFLEFWVPILNTERYSHFLLLFKQYCYVLMQIDSPRIMKTFVVSFVHRISITQWTNKIKYTERNIFFKIWNSDLLFLLRCCWESGSFGLLRRVVWQFVAKVSGNKPPLPPGLWVIISWGPRRFFFEVSGTVTPVQGATDHKTCYLNMKRVWNDKIFHCLVIFVGYSGNLAATRAMSFAAMFSLSLSLALCLSVALLNI